MNAVKLIMVGAMALSIGQLLGGELPAEYVEIPYLQSDGVAYIDSDYRPNGATELNVDCDVMCVGDRYIFGVDERKYKSNCAFAFELFNATPYVAFPASGYFQKTSGDDLALSGSVFKHLLVTYAAGRFEATVPDAQKTAVYDKSSLLDSTYEFQNTMLIFTRRGSGSDPDLIAPGEINPNLKLRRFTISEGGRVVHDFVPVMECSTFAFGLYDLEGRRFHGNANTEGDFSTDLQQVEALKEGKHRLAYLESNGNQYIDTEYVFKSKPRVVCKMQLTSTVDRDVMGTPSQQAGCFIIDYNDGSKTIYYRYGNSNGNASFSATYPISIANRWVECDFSDVVLHDGVQVGPKVANYNFANNTQSFRIFAARYYHTVRFASLKMYDGNVLVRDFIPAMVDGKIGLWDRLGRKLYENKTSTPLLLGGLMEADPGDFSSPFLVTGSPREIGTVVPPYGDSGAMPGEVIEAHAVAPEPTATERVELAGWELYYDGVKQSAGGPTNISVTAIDGATELRWLWSGQYKLEFDAEEHGAVVAENGWYASGAQVTATAFADENYDFLCWTGDVTEEQKYQNPLVVTVTAAAHIAAKFIGKGAKRLEYIGSTGQQQYIDTGYVFTNMPAVVARAMVMDGSDIDFLGMPEAREDCFIADYCDSNKTIYYRYAAKAYSQANYSASCGSLQGKWFDFAWSNIVWHGENKIIDLSKNDYAGKFATNTQKFRLFGGRTFGKIRFAWVKMYDGEELVRDFIPARINGKAGFWDRVERRFYGNADVKGAAFEEGVVIEAEPDDFKLAHDITSGEGGYVDVSDSEAALGLNITLSAMPDEGCAFAGWVGNVPEALRGQSSITFTVTESLSVRATFAQSASYVVDASGKGDFRTLGEALAAIGKEGSVASVRMTPGAYAVDETLFVNGMIGIGKVADAVGEVVLFASNDIPILVVDNDNASVSGLVISNGYTLAKGDADDLGGNVTIRAGRVENCDIVGGRLDPKNVNAGWGAANVYMTGGMLRNCRIHGSRSIKDSGASLGVYVKGRDAVVEGCDIYDMEDTYTTSLHSTALKALGGTIRGCAISNNFSIGYSTVFVSDGAIVENTLVADNFADPHQDNTIVPNIAGGAGGIVVPLNGNATLTDCTLVRNSGFWGGGLCNSGSAVVRNLTAYGNSAGAHFDDPGFPNVFGVADMAQVDMHDPSRDGLELAADVYVANGGSATAPFDSPEKATTDLSEAVRHCAEGGTVHVLAGDYPQFRETFVDRRISIVGEGRERTSVYRDPSVPVLRLVNLAAAGATLCGLAVTNGSRAAGYDILNQAGTVSNCLLGYGNKDTAYFSWNGTLRDSTIHEATGDCWYGSTHASAFCLGGDGALVEGCVIERCGNRANGYYAHGLAVLKRGRVNRCVFRSNRFDGVAAAAVELVGPAVVENSLFHDNVGGNSDARYGGAALYANGENWTIRNCTVVSNVAARGAGIYWSTNKVAVSGTIQNTIFYMNWSRRMESPDGQDCFVGNGTGKVSITAQNCLFTTPGSVFGEGSISGDPKFRNFARRDFRIPVSSPCCGVGVLWDGAAKSLDLAGNRRVTNGSIDIGCFQNPKNGMSILVR